MGGGGSKIDLDEPERLIEASACYAVMEDMAAALGDAYFCANIARDAALQGCGGVT